MLLRTRLALLLAAYLLLIALGGALVAVIAARSTDARADHRQQLAGIAATDRLDLALTSQAAAFRAFLLSGEDTALDDYEAALDEEAGLIRELAEVPLSPAEARTLAEVTDAIAIWRARAVEPLIDLREVDGVEAVAARFDGVEASALFASIETELGVLDSQLQARAATSDRAVDQARQDTALVAWVVLLSAVTFTVASTLAVRRWVTRPLTALETSVRTDAPVVVTEVAPPEIVSLGREITQMRERSDAAHQEALRFQEGLAQNAAVLLSVRSRLESTPERLPPGWSVAASLTPARGVVAGDCYDISWVRPDRLGLVVVDVAGHGSESAVVALRTKELLRAAMRTYDDLGDGVLWVNQQLDGLDDAMFMTAFAAVLDTVTGSLDYVCAGHPPALLCQEDKAVELVPTGPILGPFDAIWESARTTIGEGQSLVVYTDGLTELRDAEREEYGTERLAELVCQEFRDADGVIERCLADAVAFSAERGQDDLTIVVVCRNTSAVGDPRERVAEG
jgi:serine phosphatase RsbU (regulator of sigma subunit)/CHASE3 domain sensor protein